MYIVVIGDSKINQLQIEKILRLEGYNHIFIVESTSVANKLFSDETVAIGDAKVDLIILDSAMPEIDGIKTCQSIREKESYRDVPIIMVMAEADIKKLTSVFAAGAVDYITKPLNRAEIISRVRAALKLKHEMDFRKARESELIEVSQKLRETNLVMQQVSSVDGLTGISNRRIFDESLRNEWSSALRHAKPLSLILLEIDFFEDYNKSHGYVAGDDCLKQVSQGLSSIIKRGGDVLARYTDELFAIILPNTSAEGSMIVAKLIHAKVNSLQIAHTESQISDLVTSSLGVATVMPDRKNSIDKLLAMTFSALEKAKQDGRNRIRVG